MRFLLVPLVVLILGLTDTMNVARANVVRQSSFDERVQKADLVVIATAGPSFTRRGYLTVDGVAERFPTSFVYTWFNIRTYLKGTASRRIRVLTWRDEPEWNSECCKIGETYLLILRPKDVNEYEPVEGGSGIFSIGKH